MQKLNSTYLQTLEKFDAVATKACSLSQKLSRIPSPHAKYYWGSVLFTRLCVISTSLLMNLPRNRLTKKLIDHWDCSTAASLTRNIIDCYFNFYYLCIDNITKNEWGCRWNIYNLHDCTSRKKLFMLLNNAPQIEEFSKQEQKLKSRLLKNKYFMSLNEKSRNNFLKGKKLSLISKDTMAVHMGFKRETFRFMYEFLSSQLHSLPSSFYRMEENNLRGRGLHCETEERYTELCISWATEWLEKAVKEMSTLFSKLQKK